MNKAAKVVDIELLGSLLIHPLIVNTEELLGGVIVALAVKTMS